MEKSDEQEFPSRRRHLWLKEEISYRNWGGEEVGEKGEKKSHNNRIV